MGPGAEDVEAYCILNARASEGGFGFFRYSRELVQRADNFPPLRQIFSLMRAQDCDLVVEERLKPNDDCVQEEKLLEALGNEGKPLNRRVLRLTFLRSDGAGRFKEVRRKKALKTAEADRAKLEDLYHEAGSHTECLGYLYLYTDHPSDKPPVSYVHGAVVSVSGLQSRQCFIHAAPTFLRRTLGMDFPVTGSYFAQQQSRVTCCGHAAAMVAIKNVHAALGRKSPVTYADMNRLLAIDHQTRVAGKGLSPREMVSIIHELGGIDCIVLGSSYDETADPRLSPEEVITSAYQAVESGFPAIICFDRGSRKHAMAVVGHTFEAGLWPDAWPKKQIHDYLPGHTWVDGLIVQDDAYGPYRTLPRHELSRPECKPRVILPCFPWAHQGKPELPQDYAYRVLAEPFLVRNGCRHTLFEDIEADDSFPGPLPSDFWFGVLVEHVQDGSCVLRKVPCTTTRYLAFLRRHDIVLNDLSLLNALEAHCGTEPFWLIEISVPELYQWNNNRLGEILIRGNARVPRDGRILAVRLPGVLSLLDSKNQVTHHRIHGAYHYPIAKHDTARFDELDPVLPEAKQ